MNNETTVEATKNSQPQSLVPTVDIIENVEGITVTADMPGVDKEGLSVGIDGDQLTIEGAVSLHESPSLQNVYAEVRVARYRRTFALSRDLDTERIDASLRNGVLRLFIPKVERAKPRRIEVKAG